MSTVGYAGALYLGTEKNLFFFMASIFYNNSRTVGRYDKTHSWEKNYSAINFRSVKNGFLSFWERCDT